MYLYDDLVGGNSGKNLILATPQNSIVNPELAFKDLQAQIEKLNTEKNKIITEYEAKLKAGSQEIDWGTIALYAGAGFVTGIIIAKILF